MWGTPDAVMGRRALLRCLLTRTSPSSLCTLWPLAQPRAFWLWEGWGPREQVTPHLMGRGSWKPGGRGAARKAPGTPGNPGDVARARVPKELLA